MPQEGIGRTVQSAIYRAGAFGRRPAVPTDGTQARGGGPPGNVEARVRLRRRLGRLRGERRRQRCCLRPVARRAPDARRHDRA